MDSESCAICFDYGTVATPIVKPCTTCELAVHNKCMLNLTSNHLIQQRAVLLSTGTIHPEKINTPWYLEGGTSLHLSGFPPIEVPFSWNIKATRYLDFIKKGGICLEINPLAEETITEIGLVRNLSNSETLLMDVCPQCKGPILYSSISHDSWRFISYLGVTIQDCINVGVELLVQASTLIESFTKVCFEFNLMDTGFIGGFISSQLTWAVLTRNFWGVDPNVDTFEKFVATERFNLTEILLLNDASRPYFSAIVGIFISIVSYTGTPLSILKMMGFSMKLARQILYRLSFNLGYMRLVCDYFPDNGHEHKAFKDYPLTEMLKASFTEDYKKYLAAYPNTPLVDSVQPFDIYSSPGIAGYSILGMFTVGKLLEKCKPFIRTLYMLFKRFKLTPIHVEFLIEYSGLEVTFFLKECLEFFYYWYDFQIAKSYVPIKYKTEKASEDEGLYN